MPRAGARKATTGTPRKASRSGFLVQVLPARGELGGGVESRGAGWQTRWSGPVAPSGVPKEAASQLSPGDLVRMRTPQGETSAFFVRIEEELLRLPEGQFLADRVAAHGRDALARVIRQRPGAPWDQIYTELDAQDLLCLAAMVGAPERVLLEAMTDCVERSLRAIPRKKELPRRAVGLVRRKLGRGVWSARVLRLSKERIARLAQDFEDLSLPDAANACDAVCFLLEALLSRPQPEGLSQALELSREALREVGTPPGTVLEPLVRRWVTLRLFCVALAEQWGLPAGAPLPVG